MSNSLSPLDDVDAKVRAELLQGGFDAPEIDPTELLTAAVSGCVRGQILAAMNEDHVGVRELARKLGVSPSAVSRQLRSEGDIRISTAVILAHALGREWKMILQNTMHNGPVSISHNATGVINANVVGDFRGVPQSPSPRLPQSRAIPREFEVIAQDERG